MKPLKKRYPLQDIVVLRTQGVILIYMLVALYMLPAGSWSSCQVQSQLSPLKKSFNLIAQL